MRILRKFFPVLLVTIVFLALATPRPSHSQGPHPKSPQLPEIESLLQANGVAHVIVGLNIPFTPEGELSSAQAVDQQASITRAQADLASQLSGAFEVKVNFQFIPFVAMTIDSAALQSLLNSSLVTSVEIDDLSAPQLWFSSHMLGASTLWTHGYDGKGWTVAVLDTGVDKNHAFLTGKVISEACYNYNDGGVSTPLCPGGVYSSTATGSGVDCSTTIAGCGHGTHVAGIEAGRNGTYNDGGTVRNFSGVAPAANIIAIQVFQRFNDAGTCGGSAPCVLTYNSAWTQGLERVYALRNTYNIASANMSLGGGAYSSYCSNASAQAAINNLLSANIATVAAAGNSGLKTQIGSPACLPNVISVGATDKSDNVASYSNAASIMELWAPGSNILSSTDGSYQYFNGTSMASPQVAGTWAIMRQRYPSDSVATILARLKTYGLTVTDYRTGGSVTKQRIQLDNAIFERSSAMNNDTKATARIVPDGSLYTVGQSVKTATKDGSDPTPSCIGSASFNHTVWYKITPTVSGQMMVSTRYSGYDTVISVYSGTTEVACNDEIGWPTGNQSELTFNATAGVTYDIMISKWGSAFGNSNPDLEFKISRPATKPVQNTPTVVYTAGLSPIYTWNTVPGATAYNLVVTDFTTMTQVVNVVVDGPFYCTAGMCSYQHVNNLINNRSYGWTVSAYKSDFGWGPFADGKSFIVSLPLTTAPTANTPTGIITGSLNPAYTFTGVNGAVNYAIAVFDMETLTLKFFNSYAASSICSGLTCSVTPTGGTTTLVNGKAYGWFVAATNYAGASPWSSGKSFIPFVTPSAPTLISPTGSTTNPVTYSWNRVQGATSYYVLVLNSGGTQFVGVWVAASSVCGPTTCSYMPGGSLPVGSYFFWVASGNTAGTSSYSSPLGFNVTSAPQPAPTFAP